MALWPCVLSATAVGVVVGALVAIGVGPLSVRCCGVGSEVVRVWLRVVVDLWGSDEVAQAVEEERGPQPRAMRWPHSRLSSRLNMPSA